MPFQSEKQRRFLHANHPEIAKRWEREYANGGISNHFRKRIGYRFGGNPHEATQGSAGASQTSFGGNGGNGGGGGGGPKPHSGPTFAEIEAQKKAAAEAQKKAAEAKLAEQRRAQYGDTMSKRKKNINYFNKNLKSLIGNDPLYDTYSEEELLTPKNVVPY